MPTPEGKVKKKVKLVLHKYDPWVFVRMPVDGRGMGEPGLDFYGCCCGRHFEIETKANGKDLTPRQRRTTGEVEAAAGRVFIIRSVDDPQLAALDAWLNKTVEQYVRRRSQ